MEEKATAKTFTDARGNRYMWSSFVRFPASYNLPRPDEFGMIFWSELFARDFGFTVDEGLYEFDPSETRCTLGFLFSPKDGGKHGVFCLSGPDFQDEHAKNLAWVFAPRPGDEKFRNI
ncbi:MAG: hypothetical protein LCH78_18180 [Proteobacteria bacterium]|nr:hypothetical protein [Pseudomonadota bacterium]